MVTTNVKTRKMGTIYDLLSQDRFLKSEYLSHLGDSSMTTSAFFSLSTKQELGCMSSLSISTQRIRDKANGKHGIFEFGVKCLQTEAFLFGSSLQYYSINVFV